MNENFEFKAYNFNRPINYVYLLVLLAMFLSILFSNTVPLSLKLLTIAFSIICLFIILIYYKAKIIISESVLIKKTLLSYKAILFSEIKDFGLYTIEGKHVTLYPKMINPKKDSKIFSIYLSEIKSKNSNNIPKTSITFHYDEVIYKEILNKISENK